MKKTLLAAAVVGAFAGSAFAAPTVSLFGFVDTGFGYQHKSVTGEESTNNFSMENGINETSRWGITGEEQIGNYTVSFILEDEFNSDTGTQCDEDGRLFGREASLTVSGDFGAVTVGRVGGLSAATGSYDVIYSVGDSFDGGDWDVFGLAATPVLDNSITYQSPEFAGFKLTLQYSFKNDNFGDGDEGHSSADHYMGGALNYEIGDFQAVLGYEYVKRSNLAGNSYTGNGHLINLGFNYNFEDVAQVFVMGQYFKGWDEVGGVAFEDIGVGITGDGLKGWGAHVGAIFPVAGGDLTVGAYYVDAETKNAFIDAQESSCDVKYYGIAARYLYPLSKKVSLYAGASYGESKLENSKVAGEAQDDVKIKTASLYAGLTYAF